MSDDLINKKEALTLLRKRSQQLVGIYGDLGGAVSGAARLIDELPTADRPQTAERICGKEQTMKYENMPKGRNKDICVRCGKRANFADRLKSDVQYDLICLAETTSSGYMTHGNVKLCGKCMSELLMWLDDDDFCSYGEREGE